jgi:hypothetical protein
MTWGWQDLATLATVGTASAFLVRKFVPGFSRKPATGCSHCPVKTAGGAGSCCDKPVVITLDGLRPRGNGSPGMPTDPGGR